jgi:outer membrane protein assembly factor BamA
MLPVIKLKHLLSPVVLSVLLSSCNLARMVPEGRYMLSSAKVETDVREVSGSSLESYMKQRPTDPVISLRIYNWMKGDTGRHLMKKMMKAPAIYDDNLTGQTIRNLKIEMANRGFFNADVAAITDTSGKKIKVNYKVTAREPCRIRDYKTDAKDGRIDSILTARINRRQSELREGSIFAMDRLEAERATVSELLRNAGYYDMTADNLHYLADTSMASGQVDVTLVLRGTSRPKPYYIRDVNIRSGYDPFAGTPFVIQDSVTGKGLNIYYDSLRFLRPAVLSRNILMHGGIMYGERYDRQTYSNINRLGCVSRTQIRYEETSRNDTSMLDCNIYLTPGNIHGIQTGLDGTDKEGNLGIAAIAAYNHYNLFNGAERLSVKLRGAYEFVSKRSPDTAAVFSSNYYEFGIETSLSFPQLHLPFLRQFVRNRFTVSSEYGISFDVQKRPEFTRDFFNLNWKQKFNNRRNSVSHTISLIDVNYVMMASMSDDFRKYLNEETNVLTRFSYDNVFTAGLGYNLLYSHPNFRKSDRGVYTMRFSVESSGNLLNGIFRLSNAEKSGDGQYTILGNPFTQYVKGDIDFTQTIRINPKNVVAVRAALGMAYPYGNSSILPFEKRYYGGGPNNVRGWNTRRLGPGSFKGDTDNPATHIGDMRLILTAEYRHKWIKWFEMAGFVDAGNIWTLHNYENQPGGQFGWNKLPEEMAVGLGAGLRIDLTFLVIRLDGGKRVYDPARAEGERWVFFDKFKNNAAFYLAIGYPF